MAFYIKKFKNIEIIEFDIEVVTPMFLAGANINDAELRIPSIKGMLRFWWRATCGIKKLEEMKEQEAKIFGSTEQKGSFSVKFKHPPQVKPINRNLAPGTKFPVEGKPFKIGIIDYLAFGIRDHKKGYTRQHFPSGSQFTLAFTFYNSGYKQDILNAFYSLINNGGLGSKSRNGFGSLALKQKHEDNIKFKGRLKNYSALSDNLKLFTGINEYPTWEDALSEIGLAYKDARLSVEKQHRLLIAKPIVQAGNSKERHAKPYFLHVDKNTNGKFQGKILFMPYEYYQTEKLTDYLEVCKKVNEKLKKQLLEVQK
jgi:CRISPR-associated protein Cmr1